MKNKKIFFLADANSIHTIKWVDYFIDREYDVHLATFASNNRTKCKNIYFLSDKKSSVFGGNYHYLFSILKLATILHNVQPNYVNAHYSYSMGLIGLLAKNRAKIRANFSVVCHGSDVLAPPNRFIFDRLNEFILKRADKIFSVSDQIKDKIKTFGVESEKVFVGQYGLGIETKESKKDIDILSNRSYHTNSKIDFLLEALDDFKEKGLKIIFIIPNIDDGEFLKLKEKYSHVKFYKYVEYSKMLEFVSKTKIYISATESDGTALSLLEAMQLGTIPLISNIVSNRSWVLDGVNGYLFDSKMEFVEKLKKILSLDIVKRKDIAIINQKLLLDKGHYKNQMRKIEEFLV